MQLLSFTESGIYCEKGDFYIDPWRKVKNAVITHAHSDHARWGSEHYLAHHLSVPIMKLRLGDISVRGVNYGEEIVMNGVKISFYPAGHIIGSAQVRIEHKGEVWVVSGDYKTTSDGLTTPFEPVRCHTFITESTFGLPIFQWKPQKNVFDEINAWWRSNSQKNVATVLIGYSLGKAQRLITNIDPEIGPIFLHGSIKNIHDAYFQAGIKLPHGEYAVGNIEKFKLNKSLILAPPSVIGTPWLHKFEPFGLGIASGWMALRGTRRRRNADKGFAVSDHADFSELNQTIAATGAEKVYVTHGYTAAYVKFLREQGIDAEEVATKFVGEMAEEEPEEAKKEEM